MGNILAVNEIFGVTFQGEGFNIGKPCMFLRLAGCNLACSWCDTRYAWDWQMYNPQDEMVAWSIDKVFNRLKESPIKHLVITGGEPMLQQKMLAILTKRLHEAGWYTEIETAGTISPISTELVKHWNISPKLSTSGNDARRINSQALETLSLTTSKNLKFVISSLKDFEEIDALVNRYNFKNIIIMPEGVTVESINNGLKNIGYETIKRGYTLSTRLHVEIYGNKRAV